MSAPLDYGVVGGLTLDDVVGRGGRVDRAVPGGNALYSALGARLWAPRVGIVSFAGSDYPPAVLARLADAGIDVSHVVRAGPRSIRLWVLYEEGGRRQIFYQHGSPTLDALGRVVQEAAPALAAAFAPDAAVHIAALPVRLQRTLLDVFRGRGRTLTLDSIEACGSVGGDLAAYREPDVFEGVSAFLPSEDELDVVLGARGELWKLGAGRLRVIAVKRGARGVDLADLATRTLRRVPALAVDEVDPTGAGDAFCGGFLTGLRQTGDPLEAALRGVVSASFAIGGVGGLHLCDVTREQAEQCLRTLRERVGPSLEAV